MVNGLNDLAAGLAANAELFALLVAGMAAVLAALAAALLVGNRRLARARAADGAAHAAQLARLEAEREDTRRLLQSELAELKGRVGAIGEQGERRQTEVEQRMVAVVRDSVRHQAERDAQLQGLLHQRLEQVSDRLWQSLERVGDRVGGNLAEVSGRLGASLSEQSGRTGDMLATLNERLAAIDQAQRAIAELSGEVASLQGVLSDKQARGAYGQARMETILEDALPKGSFALQAALSNGSRPDALVDLGGGGARLAIDAKFPLEAFEALRRAESEEARRAAEAQVRANIGRHIDAIAGKYLVPGETQATALMFVPAESVYADLYERFPDLIQRAFRARVVIVSPNMLMLAVETMRAVMRDVRMREEADVIQREVALLVADVRGLALKVKELERHFAQAAKDLERVGRAAERIDARGGRIERLDLGEAAAERALPQRQAND